MINISDKAVSEVKRIVAEQGPENGYLRVRILGQGCSGFSAKLAIDDQVSEKLDNTYVCNGVNVVIDKRSALYLEDASVDFLESIDKRGFTVDVKGASGHCGCNKSFSF